MNLLDLGVIAIVVLSGLFAFSRGFVREGLSVATWVGASFFTFYAFPYARPFAAKVLPAGLLSDAASMFGPFVVSLIVLSVITAMVARRVKGSPLSSVDRTLGLVFGLVRGAFLACLGYVALVWLMPGPQPDWIAHARTKPLLVSGGAALAKLVPSELRNRASKTAARFEQSGAQEAEGAISALTTPHAPQAAPTAPAPGTKSGPGTVPVYTPADQRDLQRLFQQNAH